MNKTKKGVIHAVEIFGTLLSLFVIAFLIYGFLNVDSLGILVNEKIYTYGIPALFAISAFLDLIPQFISPMVVLGSAILAGVNTELAIAVVVLGSAIGSSLGFLIGKNYMQDAVDMLTSDKKSKKLESLVNKYGKWIVPIAAISPLPYLPMVLGAMKMSTRNFIIYGLLPRALSLIVVGYLTALF